MLLPGGPGLPRVRARSQRPQTECWRELGPHHGGPGAGTRPCPSGSLPSSSQAGPPLRSMLRHTNLAWRPPSIPPPSNLLRSAAFRVVLNLLSTCSSPELRASHKYCVGARGTTELGMGQPAGPRRAQSEPDRNPVVTQAEAHLPDGLGAPHRACTVNTCTMPKPAGEGTGATPGQRLRGHPSSPSRQARGGAPSDHTHTTCRPHSQGNTTEPLRSSPRHPQEGTSPGQLPNKEQSQGIHRQRPQPGPDHTGEGLHQHQADFGNPT